ncbi:MAG: hypothetical protein MHM6MM_001636 [Cercozoa sp. M6MM]
MVYLSQTRGASGFWARPTSTEFKVARVRSTVPIPRTQRQTNVAAPTRQRKVESHLRPAHSFFDLGARTIVLSLLFGRIQHGLHLFVVRRCNTSSAQQSTDVSKGIKHENSRRSTCAAQVVDRSRDAPGTQHKQQTGPANLEYFQNEYTENDSYQAIAWGGKRIK